MRLSNVLDINLKARTQQNTRQSDAEKNVTKKRIEKKASEEKVRKEHEICKFLFARPPCVCAIVRKNYIPPASLHVSYMTKPPTFQGASPETVANLQLFSPPPPQCSVRNKPPLSPL